MLDIAGIFKNSVPNAERLLEFGFVASGGSYHYSRQLAVANFVMQITIAADNAISVRVIDQESRDEYVLIHTPVASGSFIGSVVTACEDVLREIARDCCDHQVFTSSQAQQIIDYVGHKYHDQLEFLWQKFPDNAIFRRQDNRKWYAALLTVAAGKLGLDSDGKVASNDKIEIIDLRATAQEVQALVDGKTYLPGYHMNKKTWYTICLNGSVPTEELLARLDASYQLAAAK